jgi:poly(A)-specific ribonuclease
LEEIAKDLQNQPLPIIATDADHSKYQDTEAFHEAGYDSLLTATIMLRLAAKLGAEHNTSTHDSPSSDTNNNPAPEPAHDFIRDGREKVERPVPIPPAEPTFTQPTKAKKKKRSQSSKSAASASAASARFQTANVFDSLRTLTLDDSSESELDHNTADWGEGEPNAPAGSWQDEVYVQDESGWVPIQTMQRKAMELIPGFDDTFWDEFGNRLRVFGTQEAVLKVAGWDRK